MSENIQLVDIKTSDRGDSHVTDDLNRAPPAAGERTRPPHQRHVRLTLPPAREPPPPYSASEHSRSTCNVGDGFAEPSSAENEVTLPLSRTEEPLPDQARPHGTDDADGKPVEVVVRVVSQPRAARRVTTSVQPGAIRSHSVIRMILSRAHTPPPRQMIPQNYCYY